jgi:hypothetical protein
MTRLFFAVLVVLTLSACSTLSISDLSEKEKECHIFNSQSVIDRTSYAESNGIVIQMSERCQVFGDNQVMVYQYEVIFENPNKADYDCTYSYTYPDAVGNYANLHSELASISANSSSSTLLYKNENYDFQASCKPKDLFAELF